MERGRRRCNLSVRELRDRWMEQVNAQATPTFAGRYDVGRAIDSSAEVVEGEVVTSARLLAA